MDCRKQARAHYCKNRHGLGRAIDGGPPFLTEEQQDGRDESPCVADTDPEHKVRNVECPADAVIQSPYTDSIRNQVSDHSCKVEKRGKGNTKADPPAPSGSPFERPRNIVSDLLQRRVAFYPSRRWQDR